VAPPPPPPPQLVSRPGFGPGLGKKMKTVRVWHAPPPPPPNAKEEPRSPKTEQKPLNKHNTQPPFEGEKNRFFPPPETPKPGCTHPGPPRWGPPPPPPPPPPPGGGPPLGFPLFKNPKKKWACRKFPGPGPPGFGKAPKGKGLSGGARGPQMRGKKNPGCPPPPPTPPFDVFPPPHGGPKKTGGGMVSFFFYPPSRTKGVPPPPKTPGECPRGTPLEKRPPPPAGSRGGPPPRGPPGWGAPRAPWLAFSLVL